MLETFGAAPGRPAPCTDGKSHHQKAFHDIASSEVQKHTLVLNPFPSEML